MPVELSLPQAKPWYKSLTIQGVILSLFGALMPMLGIDLPPEQLASLGNTLGVTLNPDTIHLLVTASGGVMSIFGRARAKAPLSAGASTCVPVFLIFGLALSLSACAGGTPWSGQDKAAGITHLLIETESDAAGTIHLKKFDFADGKQKAYVKAEIELPGGYKASYTAVAVEAFEGQLARAAVEKQVSSDAAVAVPGVVKGVGEIVKDVLLPGPLQ